MSPIKSTIGRSVGKLLNTFRDRDLSLNSSVKTDRTPPRSPLTATGGSKTTVGSYTLHTFTLPGGASQSFTVSSGNDVVDFLIVGGGGAGGGGCPGGAGGGGAGAVIYKTSYGRISSGTYAVTIGAGGAQTPGNGAPPARPGSDSSIAFPTTFTAAGGGGGVSQGSTPVTDGQGGSGGGGNTNPGTPAPGRTATATPGHPGATDAVSPDTGWGNPGGDGRGANNPYHGGGGGGARTAGQPGPGSAQGGNGGSGAVYSISGSPYTYASGGGGGYGEENPTPALRGGNTSTSGGGDGGRSPGSPPVSGTAATQYGSGGGGHGYLTGDCTGVGGAGYEGIVYIRYLTS